MRLQDFSFAALVLAALASCTTYRDTVAIHFSSSPPGADVLINGVTTGFATPCMVALEKEHQIVSLSKPGYQVTSRELYPDPYNDTWFWREATVGPHSWDFPLLIGLEDFLQPVDRKNELIPARIYIKLKRAGDTPADEAPE